MSVQSLPAPARSDRPSPRSVPAAAPSPERPYRRHGAALTVGATSWAAGILAFGLEPASEVGRVVSYLSAGAFQIGLLALLRVFWRSQALGTGRLSRSALRLETALVLLAIGSTLADTTGLSDLSQPGWAALDATWPLSMLGMMLLGIRIAVAGRWKGVRRLWPLVAESWALVVIPVFAVFGPAAAQWVAPLHLLVGYAVLGLLVARKSS